MHQSRELVDAGCAVRGGPIDANGLYDDEVPFTDQRRMRGPRRDRPQPTRYLRTPAIAVGNPAPYLSTGIPRIPQDLDAGTERPGLRATVLVAIGIRLRRARHVPLVQLTSDARGAAPGESLGKHPTHVRRRNWIGVQAL